MALRFRKSFKLAPGVRMNLSGSGASLSLGPRGASIGVGKRGTYLNAGIPGTGISTRHRIGGSATKARGIKQPQFESLSVTIGVLDDGTITFSDGDGNELPDKFIKLAKNQHGEEIRKLIQNKCDEINKEIDSVGEIHLCTPSPLKKPNYIEREFEEAKPVQPSLKKPGIIQSLFRSQREKVDSQNNATVAKYQTQLQQWESRLSEFERKEADRKILIERLIYTNIDSMSEFLENSLQDIVWPRETNVSIEILDNGQLIFIDVDFPEIEDMPKKKAAVPASGNKLSVKDLSTTNIQKLYMQHVHGVAFRAVGEVFAALPKADEVVLSGYSQRPDKATGKISDEYLLSVRVKRSAWVQIAFENLELVDIVESLTRFDLRRSMSKTGVFKPIEPYSPVESGAAGS